MSSSSLSFLGGTTIVSRREGGVVGDATLDPVGVVSTSIGSDKVALLRCRRGSSAMFVRLSCGVGFVLLSFILRPRARGTPSSSLSSSEGKVHLPSGPQHTGCPMKQISSTVISNFLWQEERGGDSRSARKSRLYPSVVLYCASISAGESRLWCRRSLAVTSESIVECLLNVLSLSTISVNGFGCAGCGPGVELPGLPLLSVPLDRDLMLRRIGPTSNSPSESESLPVLLDEEERSDPISFVQLCIDPPKLSNAEPVSLSSPIVRGRPSSRRLVPLAFDDHTVGPLNVREPLRILR